MNIIEAAKVWERGGMVRFVGGRMAIRYNAGLERYQCAMIHHDGKRLYLAPGIDTAPIWDDWTPWPSDFGCEFEEWRESA